MQAWSRGYVTDIPYTTGFYRELAPGHLHFAALANGTLPMAYGRRIRYCELGCGYGFTTLALAAANPSSEFWGFDFNPSHIATAQAMAEAAGLANVRFSDLSFEQAVAGGSGDIPKFDVITAHGIYSWVAPPVREAVHQFLDRFLDVGGLALITYNALPGWGPMAPMQWLINQHAARHPGRSDQQVAHALAFADGLREAGAVYLTGNPSLATRIATARSLDAAYQAHEYLNQSWAPRFAADVMADLAEARLTFVASATLVENIDGFSVPPGMLPQIRAAQDPAWRETLRDFASAKNFRRDIYARGVQAASSHEVSTALADMRLLAMVPEARFTTKFASTIGEVNGNPEVYGALYRRLVARPASLRELLSEIQIPQAAALEAVVMLVHSGQVHPMTPLNENTKPAKAFNQMLLKRMLAGRTIEYFANPAIGSAEQMSLVDQLYLAALQDDPKVQIPSAAKFGWSVLQRIGQRLKKHGVVISDETESLAELTRSMQEFVAARLPRLKANGVI
ncbi:MAG: methyltransferase domain-containing protein [Alphaproteobacteria bacterium]|nr:MAG: methyltransferase domain-containing protein [Alphaproteobacteria bacterium]